MALTTNKKNKIIAQWKAGKFENPSQVAKHHKIDYKTAKKLVDGIPQANAHIVHDQVKLEILKKSIKNPQEISAIEMEVKERICTIEEDNELVSNNRKLLKVTQGTIQKQLLDEKGNIRKLNPKEIKSITGAIKDIENIANPRDTGTKIDVNNNNIVIPTMKDLYKGNANGM